MTKCLEGLRPQDVPWRHDQDALGFIWEISPCGPFQHKVIQLLASAIESASRPGVISIIWMSNAGVGRPEISDKGGIPRPYIILARGSPWDTPSLMLRKWPVPSPSLITRVSQWQTQLNENLSPLGHSCCNTHNIFVAIVSSRCGFFSGFSDDKMSDTSLKIDTHQ